MTLTEIKDHIMRERPSAVYLGRDEFGAIEMEARAYGWTPRDPLAVDSDRVGLKFCGCPLFEVCAKSHVYFAP